MKPSTEILHVALAANHTFIKGLEATLVSMISACSDTRRLVIHIFRDGLSQEDCERVLNLLKRFNYQGIVDFKNPDMSIITSKFTEFRNCHTAYLRLFFPNLLPDLDWVLWTDSDTLWFRDPLTILDIRDENTSLMWCRDVPSTRKSSRAAAQWRDNVNWEDYGCSGVVFMNLRLLRAHNFVQQCGDFLQKYGTPLFHDQDILNAICSRDAQIIDPKWDVLYPISNIEGGVVLHFNCISSVIQQDNIHGFAPAFEIWFRYYAQIIQGIPKRHSNSLGWYCIYRILSWLYPFHTLIAYVTNPIHPWVSDYIQRILLFTWLGRKKLW